MMDLHVAKVFDTEGKELKQGIFSTQEKAIAWADTIPGEGFIIHLSYLLDDPTYGEAVMQ